MRILVTGAAGQLGRVVVEEFRQAHTVVAARREDLDVSDSRAVREAAARFRPEAILNCAAYSHVDGAEDAPLIAFAVNALAVRSLAQAAAEQGATLVHFSSDFVFDGETDAPYTEDDRPNPQSVYGTSKLVGEWLARGAPCWYVLRVESLFGGPKPKSSFDKIVEALIDGREVGVFTDRVVSPSYTPDVAKAVRTMLERRIDAGVYHCVNSDAATWERIALVAAGALDLTPRLTRVRMADVHLRAVRPRYCALSNRKLADAGIPMPTWTDALTRYLRARRTAGSRTFESRP